MMPSAAPLSRHPCACRLSACPPSVSRRPACRPCVRFLSPLVHLLHDESGVATVWAACACAAIITLLGLILVGISAVQARHETTGWADGAALAAAVHVREGEPAACQTAAAYLVRASGEQAATMDQCGVFTHPDTQMPAVRLVIHRSFGRFTIVGRACAGPLPRPLQPRPLQPRVP